ncbi:nipblb [Symbiodinium sp. CCMP2592]|nr:nipblb [Symbiodinium sp. CCMP2592]
MSGYSVPVSDSRCQLVALSGLLCFRHAGRLFQCITLNFGARVSSFYWARCAGLLMRLLRRLLRVRHSSWIYVDDILALFDRVSAPLWASVVVVLLLCLKIPMSWRKGMLAPSVLWIGWQMDFDGFTVRLDPAKLSRLVELAMLLLQSRDCFVRDLERLTGKLLWLSSLFRCFRPSLAPLYADQRSFTPVLTAVIRLWLDLAKSGSDIRSLILPPRFECTAFADACADDASVGMGGFVRLQDQRQLFFQITLGKPDMLRLFPWLPSDCSLQSFIATWELAAQAALLLLLHRLLGEGHLPCHTVFRCDNSAAESAPGRASRWLSGCAPCSVPSLSCRNACASPHTWTMSPACLMKLRMDSAVAWTLPTSISVRANVSELSGASYPPSPQCSSTRLLNLFGVSLPSDVRGLALLEGLLGRFPCRVKRTARVTLVRPPPKGLLLDRRSVSVQPRCVSPDLRTSGIRPSAASVSIVT